MPIKVVPVQEAPNRMHGKVSHNQDYMDVMTALKTAKTGEAIVVSMADPSWFTKNEKQERKYPKPEVAFAYMLRRHFATSSLPLTAYQSGKMEVTIRRQTPAEATRR